MSARTGLSQLIDVLRGMVNASTADYTVGTATFWDGDQMQAVLDRHRRDVFKEELYPLDTWVSSGSVAYYDYYSSFGNYEQTTGGTAVWWIEDGTGADVGTALFTVDYMRGHITFSADTAGSVYYLTGRSYDLNAAAAEIWDMKASHYAVSAIDWSSDNHSVRNSQMVSQCEKMAARYLAKALPARTILTRGDIDVNALD